MVDTRDLKSLGQKCPYGFDSHPWHKTNNIIFSFNVLGLSKPNQTRLKDWIRELVMVKTHINQNCRAVEPCHCLTLIFIGR